MMLQSNGVDTVSKTRWGRTVIKNVAQVRVAQFAADFDSCHAMGVVFNEFYVGSFKYIVE